jgi:D-alanyl-D-alanine carboxypeptidase/D-alanyl-D-alanine-endopeptidase (penicillin-binding protein 4)
MQKVFWSFVAGFILAASSPTVVAQTVVSAAAEEPQLKPVEEIGMAWLRRGELQQSLIGIEVLHVPTNRVLFSFNGRRRFTPASTAKVLTTSCAFDLLGGGYRYKTRLLAGGPIQEGHLRGSLIVAPSQDPSMDFQDVISLLGALKSSKIQQVDGTIEMAPVAGGSDNFATEWMVQDWGQDWMPPSSNLIVDSNVVPTAQAGRGLPVVAMSVDGDHSALTSSLMKSAWAPAWASYHPGSHKVHLYKGVVGVIGSAVVANPEQFHLAVIRHLVKGLGVKVAGQRMPIATEGEHLGEHWSKPLSDLIRHTLKESDNLYSQQLLRTIGAQVSVTKKNETASLEERGLLRLNQWIAELGVPASEAILWDGCGLARKNAVSPHVLNAALRKMSGPQGDGAYISLLPHSNDPLETPSSFRYKTGAMDSVRGISGILRTAAGEPLAVTVLINAHSPSIRELRSSLSSLIDKLESLGPLTVQAAEAMKARAAAHQPAPKAPKAVRTGTGGRQSTKRKPLRRSRRHR